MTRSTLVLPFLSLHQQLCSKDRVRRQKLSSNKDVLAASDATRRQRTGEAQVQIWYETGSLLGSLGHALLLELSLRISLGSRYEPGKSDRRTGSSNLWPSAAVGSIFPHK